MRAMHEVDYKIFGEDIQFVEIELDPGEAAIAEAGGMFYMEDSISMETIFGDGSQQNTTFVDALLGAGKRLLIGESLFMTVFLNTGRGKKRVAFAAPYPGKIVPIKLSEIGGELITQKDSFLVAAKGVSIGIAFQKRLGAGFFGGEGFIMERLQGDGWAFVHAGGTLIDRTLASGEVIRVDTGCTACIDTNDFSRSKRPVDQRSACMNKRPAITLQSFHDEALTAEEPRAQSFLKGNANAHTFGCNEKGVLLGDEF